MDPHRALTLSEGSKEGALGGTWNPLHLRAVPAVRQPRGTGGSRPKAGALAAQGHPGGEAEARGPEARG